MLLLERCSVPEIVAALKEVSSAPRGRQKRDELLSECRLLTADQANHERMCAAVLNTRSAERVRALCRWWGIRSSRLTKQAAIDAFVREDSASSSRTAAVEAPASAASASSSGPLAEAFVTAASASSSGPAAAEPPASVSTTQLVLHDGNRMNKRFRKQLMRRLRRLACSSRIKAVIRSRDWRGRTVSEVRAAVSQQSGVSLQVGEKRAFFERQLERHLRRHRRTRARPQPKRQPMRVLSDSWVGGVHQEHREHAPMRLNDYFSRKAFATAAEPLAPSSSSSLLSLVPLSDLSAGG